MNKGTEKKSFWNAFTITDRASCESAIRNGGWAAMISAGLTALLAVAGFFITDKSSTLGELLSPWLFIDVVVIVVLGLFVFRKSRTASTILLIYFVLGKVSLWIDSGKVTGLPLTAIFFLYYFTAMRGTYAWHKTYKHEQATGGVPG